MIFSFQFRIRIYDVILFRTMQKMLKKYDELNEIHQNAEKRNTGLTEEQKQLKKNQKKTAESLKTEEEKVGIFLTQNMFSSQYIHDLCYFQLKKLMKVPEDNHKQIERLTDEETELNKRRQEEEAAFQAVMSSLQQETKAFQEEKDKLQAEQIKLKKKYDDMRTAVSYRSRSLSIFQIIRLIFSKLFFIV